MLKKILSPEFCAKCGFCCVFKVCHLWETPKFDEAAVQKHRDISFCPVEVNGTGCYTYCSPSDYQKDPQSDYPCPFLDTSKGCVLDGEDKPFECSIWPFRVMNRNGRRIVAVAMTCPGMKKYSMEELTDFLKSELLESILAYIPTHEYIIKEYTEDYYELLEL